MALHLHKCKWVILERERQTKLTAFCLMCRQPRHLPDAGAAARGVGEERLAWQTHLPALHQQGEVGGDAGGGRHQDG